MKTHIRSLVGWGLFGATLAFYLYTLAPSVVWGDGVKLQTEVALGGSVYFFFYDRLPIASDGLPFARLGVAAWDHPLYVMLGQLFLALPWGDMAFRVNLVSAVAAAITVALTYQVGLLLSDQVWASAVGALALAVSHTFWWHAVSAEVYSLHLLFAISLIGLTLHWVYRQSVHYLSLFALLAGLGLANHLMVVLILIPSIVFIALAAGRERTRPQVGTRLAMIQRALPISMVCITSFVIGLTPWWIQFARMVRQLGWQITLLMVMGYPFLPGSLSVRSLDTLIANGLAYAAWLLYQFTLIGVGLGVYGGLCLWRAQRQVAWYLIALFSFQVAFSANYNVADRFAFHLGSYLIFALLIVGGLASLSPRITVTPKRRVLGISSALALLVALPIMVYAMVPPTLHALGITDQTAGILPIGVDARDALATFLNPNQRGNDSAARFGRSTLEQLAPNALVLMPNDVDGEAYLVLRYYQLVEQLRPDVYLELLLFRSSESMPQAVLNSVHMQSSCRPIYIASRNPQAYPLQELQREFDIIPEANLFRLRLLQSQGLANRCSEPEQQPIDTPLDRLIQEAMQWR